MFENLAVVSIIFLVIVIGIGFIKKMNIGYLAIGASVILAAIGGISAAEVYAGFDAKLFTQLVGVTYLFGIAQNNGTLELLAKKGVAMLGEKTWLVPFMLFFITGILSALGPGHISMGALMTVAAVTIAVNMGKNPILYALVAKAGANAFSMSPISPAGILGTSLGEKVNQFGFEMPVFFNGVLWGIVCFIIFSIAFRSQDKEEIKILKATDLPSMNKEQYVTLGGIAVMIVIVLGFNQDVGLASFLVAAILSMTGYCDERKAASKIPWGTLILICGTGVLINLVNLMGGITILTDTLLAVTGPKTAAPLLAAASSLLSLVSSTTGVVMPMLMPTLPEIVAEYGNLSFIELTSAVVTASFSSAFSPASTGGGLILAAYAAAANVSAEEQNKLFGKLLIIAVIVSLTNVVLSGVGFYSFLG